MKRISALLRLMFIALISSYSFAQIPNNGFENWNSSGSCLQPQGWACINDWIGLTENCYSMSRSTDHFPPSIGSYSIQIENNFAVLPDAGAFGLVWTGDSTGFGTDNPAFSISGHPTSLCGYYKFLPQDGDTMDIHFVLYKNGDEITSGKFLSASTASSWTPFVIPVTDASYATVDSARIMMSSFSSDNIMIHGNSILLVDNLSFDALISTVEVVVNNSNAITVYANPSAKEINVHLDYKGEGNCELKLFNTLGAPVFETVVNGRNDFEINSEALPAGIYVICLTQNNRTLDTRKIAVY